MNEILPTVTVKRGKQNVVINAEDYDPKTDKLVEDVVETEVETEKSFEDMTVKELQKYAKDNNIDLGDATKKADIIDVLDPKEDDVELYVMPNADGKFQIFDKEGQAFSEEVYETMEDAEAAIAELKE